MVEVRTKERATKKRIKGSLKTKEKATAIPKVEERRMEVELRGATTGTRVQKAEEKARRSRRRRRRRKERKRALLG